VKLNSPSFSIVIPVYKSSKSLERIARQVIELQEQENHQFELIFVNDSPFYPETCRTLQALKKQYNNIKVISLRKNEGQHLALLAGMKHAGGDYIITMDDDLQHPVREIPKLIRAIRENKNVKAVFAIPAEQQKKHHIIRRIGSFISNKIDVYFLHKPSNLVKSSFRIFTRKVGRAMVHNYNAMPSFSCLLINTSSNIINIEVEHDARAYGRSNYTLTKLISLTLNQTLHYSSLPLQIMGVVGFGGFLFSVFYIAVVIIRYFVHGIPITGWASIVTLICFFGGLILLSLGIIGEYLIRIIKEQQKPNLDDLIDEIL